MSLILYISLGKIQKFTIYREIAINLGKTKKRKGLFHIYKKPPYREIAIYKESGQSIKKKQCPYIQGILGQYIQVKYKKGVLLYIGKHT